MDGWWPQAYVPSVKHELRARTIATVERACTEARDADTMLEAVADAVGRAVPHDGALWLGVDPATLLATAPGRVTGLEASSCTPFWNREFQVQDAILYRDLAREPVPVATLHSATGGHPVRSARYRELLAPHGYHDELRAVFRHGGRPAGLLGLYREPCHCLFDDDDVALVHAVAPTVAAALVRFSAMKARWDPTLSTPGLLLFGPDDHLISANTEAQRWLSELIGFGGLPAPADGARDWVEAVLAGEGFDLTTPAALCALVARTRAVAIGAEPGPARLRLRGHNDRWLVLHGSCLAGQAPDLATVAIVIEPAKSAEIAPILIDAYALTPRELDVVLGIARGLSTAELAAALFISVHTVRDYVKSVFEKVSVTSRGELVAKLFAEHYSDAFHAGLTHE